MTVALLLITLSYVIKDYMYRNEQTCLYTHGNYYTFFRGANRNGVASNTRLVDLSATPNLPCTHIEYGFSCVGCEHMLS